MRRFVVFCCCLLLPAHAISGEVQYAKRGATVTLSAPCKSALAASVDVVHPVVPLSDVLEWYCARDYQNTEDPSRWYCSGAYSKTMTVVEWVAMQKADGRLYRPASINGDNVTIVRRGKTTSLNASQKATHAVFVNMCLEAIPAALIDFRCRRSASGADVVCAQHYFATAASEADFATEVQAGKVLWVVQE